MYMHMFSGRIVSSRITSELDQDPGEGPSMTFWLKEHPDHMHVHAYDLSKAHCWANKSTIAPRHIDPDRSFRGGRNEPWWKTPACPIETLAREMRIHVQACQKAVMNKLDPRV
jgi:hypothetical protein